MTRVPPLQTHRLLIREFTLEDLPAIHRLLDVDLAGAGGGSTLDERRHWLQWTVLGYTELAQLHQPPSADRAMVAKTTGELLGTCGFVPCLAPFAQIPALRGTGAVDARHSPDVGLYWAVSPVHQRREYATEAAQALVTYAFTTLQLRRIVATTASHNAASIAVMRKLGMQIDRNPYPNPPWLQVVGILESTLLIGTRNSV